MCIITSTVMSTTAMVVMAIASAAAAATSTAVGLSQASAQKKTAAFQMEEAKKQAQKAELEAAYERQEGVEDARRQKLSAILKMSDTKVKMAGNNIALSSSTVLNMENDAKINSELDALTTQNNAEKKAQSLIDKRNSLYQNAALISFNNRLNSSSAYAQLGTNYLNNLSQIK